MHPVSWVQASPSFPKRINRINENQSNAYYGSTANTTTRNSPIKHITFTYSQSPTPSEKKEQKSPV